ncbi:MAG: putative oxidoreductase [Solirubrobacteraceae bacterium]|nr:putative oxidoreductase [Solirubrobacteraceae bacterium]
MQIGRLAARTVIGGLFIGHGTQKLFGWFGGPGLDGAAAGFDAMGMRPGRRNAIAAGLAETAGGGALALGLALPLAGAALIGTMITAIRTVHLKNGPWNSNGGYEYNLVLIVAVLALVEAGPGCLSLDAARGSVRRGPSWALAALAVGAAASTAALELAKREAAAHPLPAAA